MYRLYIYIHVYKQPKKNHSYAFHNLPCQCLAQIITNIKLNV